VLDWGEESLLETFESLDSRDLPFFGAGHDLAEARKAFIVEQSGLKVGFLGYTTTLPQGFEATDTRAGVNPIRAHTAYHQSKNLLELPGLTPSIITWTEPNDLERMRVDVEAVASEVDVLLVYVHWGTSMNPYVHDFQKEIGRTVIDSGAHAVFGGHQHVPSAIEFYKGCPIVHSTGNLIFDKWEPHFTAETLKTFLVGGTLEKGGIRDLFMKPVKGGVEVPPEVLPRTDPLWDEIFTDLKRMCDPFGTVLVAGEDGISITGGE
jgi:poly-gamma-glutamate synthesis protein (capsule biosynthesis protein)